MQQSHLNTRLPRMRKHHSYPSLRQGSVQTPSPASLPPPIFTCFPALPFELQLMIWEFALPYRTIHIDARDLLRGRLRLPPHLPPSITRVCRDAHTVVTKAGRWLWLGRALQMQQQLLQQGSGGEENVCSTTTTAQCTTAIKELRKNIVWFDAARDTLMVSNLLLWPQDTKVNPVAVEIPISDIYNATTAATGVYFDVLAELKPRMWHVNLSMSQLLHFQMLPSPLEVSLQSYNRPPEDPVDLRMWTGYSTASTTTPTTDEIAYTDCDLSITVTQPLAPKAHAEFFPEGSMACFIDLSALELSTSTSSSSSTTPPPPPPPSLLSSYSSPQPPSEPAARTLEKLDRLQNAYAFSRDPISKTTTTTTTDTMQILSDLVAQKPTERAALFERKRRALAFKWLRINWMELSKAEKQEPGVRGAAWCYCCCSDPPSPNTPSSTTSSSFPLASSSSPPISPATSVFSSCSSSSSSSSSSSWLPASPTTTTPTTTPTASSTSAQPSSVVVYRMPRPYAAAFACPRQFDTEHPWTRRVLEAMPRFRIGLLVKLDGVAAVAAGGFASGPLPGRRISGTDVVIRAAPW